jgi:uncharacterized protein with von Willebrand factor type A (vWA) domain
MLLRNILWFGRLLRAAGLDVHTGRLIDAVRGLELVGMTARDDVRHALRTALVHRREDLERFDRAFELFWRRHEPDESASQLHSLGERPRRVVLKSAAPVLASIASDAGTESDQEQEITGAVQTYSPREVLRLKDFARFTPEEITDARALLRDLNWRVGRRRSRRWAAGRGRRLDLRRIIRRSMRYGGEPLDLPRRARKEKMRPLVVIADVSGSMERYSRMLLQFAHALVRRQPNIEAFLFSTRITRVTRYLSAARIDDAVARVARAVSDWGGGTRIGDAVRTYNRQWGRRLIAHGPVVLFVSDGWDRGDPELLRREIARLHRASHHLIWLNPLLGSPAYQPLTRGMQAALPHVDDFLPVHNLVSLEALALHLNKLGSRRGTSTMGDG